MLDEGVYTAVSEIGGTEMINKSYVSVANARAAGTALPASWEEQRRLLSARTSTGRPRVPDALHAGVGR
jgi:hypothetical protein